MIPVTLGLGLINVNAVIDTYFASRFIDPTLSPSAIQKAFLVYMLPQGMFSVAIATVLFPTLSRYAARGNMEGFQQTVSIGLRGIAFMLFPAAVVSAVLAEPIIRILFQHGKFLPDQTPVVAGALALGNLALNAGLDLAFYRFGTWGIPLSTALCNLVSTAALAVLLHRRLGRLDDGSIRSAVVRIVGASAFVAVVSYIVWKLLDSALGRSLPAQTASLGLALVAGGLAYWAGCRVLKVRELQALLSVRSRSQSG
jgi:putative peptidoglycan lipid II flippase